MSQALQLLGQLARVLTLSPAAPTAAVVEGPELEDLTHTKLPSVVDRRDDYRRQRNAALARDELELQALVERMLRGRRLKTGLRRLWLERETPRRDARRRRSALLGPLALFR